MTDNYDSNLAQTKIKYQPEIWVTRKQMRANVDVSQVLRILILNLSPLRSPRRNRIIFSWIIVSVYMTLIFVVSAISDPIPEGMPKNEAVNSILHFIEYLILGCIVIEALRITFQNYDIRYLIALSIFITILYACTDEIHQSFIPGRLLNAWDLIMDSLGGMAGTFIGIRFRFYRILTALTAQKQKQ